MSDHRFKIGEHVKLTRGFPDRSGAGTYEITRLLPESANGDRHYRVKGTDKIERAVEESQIRIESFGVPAE